ncbi:CYTH domain-containing protein [Candidatus Berkelbacteria bacterium]|nr:CYTH domain-containing protein [Candidatus Berkelbacteria bacterium]
MIEVERKFLISDAEEVKLLEEATLIRERTFTDIYYDADDFRLTKKDHWLRQRDGKWELKAVVVPPDSYDEIEDEVAILQALQLPQGTLQDRLDEAGVHPFCRITTTRRTYERDGFTIDLDSADYGYRLLEIEQMVAREDQIQATIQAINGFAASFGINVGEGKVRGKIMEYLRRKSPRHLQLLVESGVVAA